MDPIDALLQQTGAFQTSRVILTAVELDLFTLLEAGPLLAADLSGRLGADRRALTRLLDALVVLELLETGDAGYRATDRGARLSAHHPESVRAMALHHNTLWRNWSHLTDTVRHGSNPAREALRAARTPEEWDAFVCAMEVPAHHTAAPVAESVDLTGSACLLDIGGATGSYTIAFLRRYPHLKAILFDLEPVVPLARARLEQEGLLERVTLVPGDFDHDPLPTGADTALLSAIIHQNGPEENQSLFRKIHAALAPGGRLIIRDYIMDPTRTHPPRGALFALNMLVCTPHGDTFTRAEVEEALTAAGFVDVQQVGHGERMDDLVTARKPG